jgi:hypothetical protein
LASAATTGRPRRATGWIWKRRSSKRTAAGGGIRLRLGWQPERLLFLAQGAGPYELVSGRARDQIEASPQHRLVGWLALSLLREMRQA